MPTPLIASAAATAAVDPVVALWERVLSTEAAYGAASEDDEVANAAAEKRMEDAAERFIQTKATTAYGMALKLKHLARVNSHEKEEGDRLIEVRIVRDLIRQLTGDPNWTIEQELAETVTKPQPPSNPQPVRRVYIALDIAQTDQVEHALNRISQATEFLDDLQGDLWKYSKLEAEAGRLAFLSEAITTYASDALAILAAAQPRR